VSLLFNIVAPVLIMTKLSGDAYLGPIYSLVIALLFPVTYAVYDFINRKNVNIISILGFTSILLTGVFGLFELSPLWIAVKEASVPLIIGVIVLATVKTEKNLVTKILFNEDVMDLSKVHESLREQNKSDEFQAIVIKSSYWVAVSFFLSSTLNFILARIVLQSEPGTSAYVEELGRMNALSFPVIALPSTLILGFVLFNVFKHIKRLTGYSLEDIVVSKK
jgi:hypothetical protein